MRKSVRAISQKSPFEGTNEDRLEDGWARNMDAASSASGSVFERSDELATRRHGQESPSKFLDKKNADGSVGRCSLLVKDFTDNLTGTELLALSHNSQSSFLERIVDVVTKTRKHSSYTHFPKDRNCDVCFRTKRNGLVAEDALAKLQHKQKSSGT